MRGSVEMKKCNYSGRKHKNQAQRHYGTKKQKFIHHQAQSWEPSTHKAYLNWCDCVFFMRLKLIVAHLHIAPSAFVPK